jgi:hypothetical protein
MQIIFACYKFFLTKSKYDDNHKCFISNINAHNYDYVEELVIIIIITIIIIKIVDFLFMMYINATNYASSITLAVMRSILL